MENILNDSSTIGVEFDKINRNFAQVDNLKMAKVIETAWTAGKNVAWNTGILTDDAAKSATRFERVDPGSHIWILGINAPIYLAMYQNASNVDGTFTGFLTGSAGDAVVELAIPENINFIRFGTTTTQKDSLVIVQYQADFVNKKHFKNNTVALAIAAKKKDAPFYSESNLITSFGRGLLSQVDGSVSASASYHSTKIRCSRGVPMVLNGLTQGRFTSGTNFGTILIYNSDGSYSRTLKFYQNTPFLLVGNERFVDIQFSFSQAPTVSELNAITLQYAIHPYTEETVNIIEHVDNITPKCVVMQPLGDNMSVGKPISGHVSVTDFVILTKPESTTQGSSFYYLDVNKKYYLYTTYFTNTAILKTLSFDNKLNFIKGFGVNGAVSIGGTPTIYRYEVQPFSELTAFSTLTANAILSEKLVTTSADYTTLIASNTFEKVVKTWDTSDCKVYTNLLRKFSWVDSVIADGIKRVRIPIVAEKNYTYYLSNLATNVVFQGEIVDSGLNKLGDLSDYFVTSTSNMRDEDTLPIFTSYFKAPTSAAYMDIKLNSYNKQYLAGAAIIEGVVADLKLDDILISSTIDSEIGRYITANKKEGNYVICLGDSITAQGKWQPTLIKNKGAMMGIKQWYSDGGGVGGSRIMPVPVGGVVAVDDYSIWARAKVLATNNLTHVLSLSEKIILMGGTNDLNKSALIGSVTDVPLLDYATIPLTDSYSYLTKSQDVTKQNSNGLTFASCFKGILETLIADYPSKKIIVPSFIYFPDMDVYATTRAEAIEIHELMHEICKYYGVLFVDMLYTLGMNNTNKSIFMPDLVHPSKEGGRRMGEYLAIYL